MQGNSVTQNDPLNRLMDIIKKRKTYERERRRRIGRDFSFTRDTMIVANHYSILVLFFVLIFHWCKKQDV